MSRQQVPWLIMLAAVSTVGCSRRDLREAAARARINVERLARHEMELLRSPDLARFVSFAPFPPGRPWETPGTLGHNEFGLETGSRGEVREQYEVRVDPVGIAGPTLTTYPRLDGGGFGKPQKSFELVPGWCEIIARGRLGPSGEFVELTKRLWLAERQPMEGPVEVRPVGLHQ
jgi:hypothetical protein